MKSNLTLTVPMVARLSVQHHVEMDPNVCDCLNQLLVYVVPWKFPEMMSLVVQQVICYPGNHRHSVRK